MIILEKNENPERPAGTTAIANKRLNSKGNN